MRLETHFGRLIVCGHIFKASSIKPGQSWQSTSSTPVTVTEVDGEWVTYMQYNGVPHTKDAFSFQCRYSLIVDSESDIPKE